MLFGSVGEGFLSSDVHRNPLGQGSPTNGVCEFATQSGKGLNKAFPGTIKILQGEGETKKILRNFVRFKSH